MTHRFLLDTNVLAEPLKARPNAGIMRKLHQHDGEFCIPTPVWHEMWFGCLRLGRRAIPPAGVALRLLGPTQRPQGKDLRPHRAFAIGRLDTKKREFTSERALSASVKSK